MKVVMVCTGNTCRSPLAEVITLDKMKKDSFFEGAQVASCGIHAMSGDEASHYSQVVAKNHCLDLSQHRSKPLSVYHLIEADYVFTMTHEQAELLKLRFPDFAQKILPLNEEKSISDPYGGDEALYEATYQEIDTAVDACLEKIKGDYDQ
jgi:protein tyrosine phosphatase